MFTNIGYYSPTGILRYLPHTKENVSRYNSSVRERVFKVSQFKQHCAEKQRQKLLYVNKSNKSSFSRKGVSTPTPPLIVEPFHVKDHDSAGAIINRVDDDIR